MKDTHFSFMAEEPNTVGHRNPRKSGRRKSALPTKPNKTSQHDNSAELQTKSPKPHQRSEADDIVLHGLSPAGLEKPEALMEGSGRERLKRHRTEVAGRVLIPDNWSQEELLKDWIDYSSFDALLVPTGIASAREALVAEGRRESAGGLRIKSRC